jgi:chromosome partitioning protein
MYTISITNEKGGVAKTTTALALGGALVEAGYEVLLVDLDTQANLTLGLGLTPVKLHRTSADVLMNAATIVSASRETEIPGLDVVPANAEMGMAERFLPVRQNFEDLLKNALAGATKYDFVLLDCPPSLGAVTMNALKAADLVIAPTQPEYFSVYGLRSIMAAIRKVRAQGNPDLAYYILITMMDRRNRIHRTLREQLQNTFGEGLLKTVIEVDTKLRESSVAGKPIMYHSPNSRSAGQYRALAQELIENVKARTTEETAEAD